MRRMILFAVLAAWIVGVSGCQSGRLWPWRKDTTPTVVYGEPGMAVPGYFGPPVASGACSPGCNSCGTAPIASSYQAAAPISIPGQ